MNKALLIALTILGFATRFYNISAADFSVWDESHFGKFAAQYIKGEFYHDVHPPLGKMLLGLSGWISGLSPNSNFDFGFHYASNVPYTFMRMFAATFGAALIPLAYATAIQLKMTNSAAAFAALMIIFDMALANISRFILLDPILLFFTATAVYGAAVFRNVRSRPFTSEWWLWLFVTGASLGCVSSVKMMGLFVVALVGLLTIQDLAGYLVDMRFQRITGIIFIKHFLYRSLLLIVLPLSIYISTFYIQFQILTRSSGQDDDIMSSLFQSSLVDTSLKDIPLFVAYGSRLTLKNNGPSGGILQTHIPGIIHPGREHHQAVSCSKQKTDYTHWLIEKQDVNNNDGSVTYVKDGDVVMLSKLEKR